MGGTVNFSFESQSLPSYQAFKEELEKLSADVAEMKELIAFIAEHHPNAIRRARAFRAVKAEMDKAK